MPLVTGGNVRVVVRGGVRLGGGVRFTVVPRLDDVEPPPVAAPVVPPPTVSCWAMATPAKRNRTSVNRILLDKL